jgi:hypothetical protein
VTAILNACGLGPDFQSVHPATLEAARVRGTAVHGAIEAAHYGYEVEIAPEIAPYLTAYHKFVTDSGHEPIASEFAVVHPTWEYVGHLDRVGWLVGRRVVIDWKTGDTVDLVSCSYQLAAYRLAWCAVRPEEPVESIAVVQLRDDGGYRLHELEWKAAEDVFLAALVVYRARERRRAA